MTTPIYISKDGTLLVIEPSTIAGSCRLEVTDPELEQGACVIVKDTDVPAVAGKIAAAMSEATGLPQPILLQRRRPDLPEGITVSWDAGPGQPVVLGIRGITARLNPAGATEVAAALALSAEAESGPQMAIAENVAELVRVYGREQGGRLAARAILCKYELRARAL